MEILNQVILAGNLTDQPSVSDAGGRQFIRARLAQSWFYETQGKTVEHRQFIPLIFFGESTIAAKSFQKGDNIHVTGQLIRREAPPAAGRGKHRARTGNDLRDPRHSRFPHRGSIEAGAAHDSPKRYSANERREANSILP
jgi:single-stranded DNA-binding protein